MFSSILLSILLAFLTLTVVLCLFYFFQEGVEGENKLLTCIVVSIIVLIFSIQFGCFLYDKFSGEYAPTWISLFFFLFNLFSLGMLALIGFVFIGVAGNESKSKIYTISTCIFIFLIAPYIIYHSFSTFFLKVNDLAIESNFTFFECVIFVLIIFLAIFIFCIKPIFEKKYLEKERLKYKEEDEVVYLIEAGYLFYSDPTLLLKGGEGLNSVIEEESFKFKNGLSNGKYALSFGEGNKSFEISLKSSFSGIENFTVYIDENNDIRYSSSFTYFPVTRRFILIKRKDNQKDMYQDSVRAKSIIVSEEKDFLFEEHENSISITKYTGDSNHVVIPPSIKGKAVTTIASSSFASSNISSISMPNTVETIEDFAFADNTIEFFSIHDGLIYIGEGAFKNNCIDELLIPSSLKEIGKQAFSKNKIEKLIFNDGLEKICEQAFESNLIEEINFPHSLSTIEQAAFNNNPIKKIRLFEKLSLIEDQSLFDTNIIASVKKDSPYYSNESGFLSKK